MFLLVNIDSKFNKKRDFCKVPFLRFEEERRRTKVFPGFLTEKVALKLIFSVLIRTSKRYQRVRFSPMTIEQLNALRKELGIKDEPSIVFKKFS